MAVDRFGRDGLHVGEDGNTGFAACWRGLGVKRRGGRDGIIDIFRSIGRGRRRAFPDGGERLGLFTLLREDLLGNAILRERCTMGSNRGRVLFYRGSDSRSDLLPRCVREADIKDTSERVRASVCHVFLFLPCLLLPSLLRTYIGSRGYVLFVVLRHLHGPVHDLQDVRSEEIALAQHANTGAIPIQ